MKKSIFISALIGVLVGSMITMLAMPSMVNKVATGIQSESTTVKEDTGKDVQASYIPSDNIYKQIVKKAMPSVVGIKSQTEVTDFFWGSMPQTGIGTGIIVDPNGYILTNNHVVSNEQTGKFADKVTVYLPNGEQVDGKVVWGQSSFDIAVVKVEKTGLKAAEIGDSDKLEVGDIAVAIGNPLGLDFDRTVTEGIISGLHRNVSVGETPTEFGYSDSVDMEDLIQTSAAINHGNSGGPLLNDKGQVIGINTLKEGGGEALGFAIPINAAKPLVEQIISTGTVKKVVLGVSGVDAEMMQHWTGDDLNLKNGGAYVIKVSKGSIAAKSGIEEADIIIKLDKTEIKTMKNLSDRLYYYKAGDVAKMTVLRDGKEEELTIKF